MKALIALALPALLFFGAGSNAAEPDLEAGVLIENGPFPLDVDYHSSPFAADWNNDGRKDLLCGEYYGRVHLLINEGTDSQPVFSSSVFLLDGAAVLDAGNNSDPEVCDWNRDGKKDLLCGNSNGTVLCFANKGTDEDPVFDGAAALEAGGSTIGVASSSAINTIDWDCDGVLDLLCGFQDVYGSPRAGVYYFHALGPLSIDANTLSRSGGGSTGFRLAAGSAFAGRDYILLGSASGTEPGIALPGGGVLPLNNDPVLRYILSHSGSPPFTGFRGFLDGNGSAAAALTVPGLPLAAGTVVNFAYTTEAPFDYQSNAVSVEILP
jgi:hypothetical protein